MFEILVKFLHETVFLFLEMSPYLILGFFFAGLLHVFISENYIRRHFSNNRFSSIFKAAIFGVPLPICSCGVIPLAESIRKDGASKSATMSFLVSTPSSGVDSIFATYALLGPVYAIVRPIASLVSGIFIGLIIFLFGGPNGSKSNRDNTQSNHAGPTLRHQEKRKLIDGVRYGFKTIPADIVNWLLIGLVIGGLISALVPEDFGTKYLGTPVLNYLIILFVSVPIYVCATGSIPIALSLLAKGVLPGAALAFLIAGPATNTVTISFVLKRLGKRIMVFYILAIMLISVAFGVLFDTFFTIDRYKFGPVSVHEHNGFSFIHVASGILLALILLNSRVKLSKLFKTRQEKMSIKVNDMTCQHCKIKIEQVIREISGIKDIDVDLKTGEVRIDTEFIEKETIMKRIKDAGYSPE